MKASELEPGMRILFPTWKCVDGDRKSPKRQMMDSTILRIAQRGDELTITLTGEWVLKTTLDAEFKLASDDSALHRDNVALQPRQRGLSVRGVSLE